MFFTKVWDDIIIGLAHDMCILIVLCMLIWITFGILCIFYIGMRFLLSTITTFNPNIEEKKD